MFLLLWIFITCSFGSCVGDEGLYKSKDDVIILTNSSFLSSVLGSENAWLVEFYNSWCGHCVRFAPEYNKLATDIKGWQKVISVGAVDCSQKHNIELCREYDIKGYPSLVFFPPFASKEYRGKYLHDQDVASIRRKAVDYVSNFTGFHKPASWPMLEPLSSVEKIWDEAKDEHKHVILVFEYKASYIGRQVILDLSQYKHLLIRTVNNKNIAKFGVTHLPSYFLLHGDGRFENIAEDIDDRAALVKIIKKLINANDQNVNNKEVQVPPNGKQEETVKTGTTKQNQGVTNGTVVYMQDLESALSYSFRQEIAIHKSVEDDALQALKDFIRVLSKYFPGEDYLMKFLWKVKVWLDTITSGLTGEVWVYNIDNLQTVDTYLPETINWVGCKGSESRYRGYPCSMWTLFHTLTANAYRVGKDSPKFLYAEVLNAVTDYMKYFFGCETCSKHFLSMADKRHITSAEDQVIWLWSAHNQANQRLHGDQSEDPLHPKILFPSVYACTDCRKGIGDKPVWDETEVLKFIVKMYSKENIVRRKQNINIASDTGEKKSSQEKSRTELDWWERMQREKDLKKLKEIRRMKKQKLKEFGEILPVSNNKKVKLKTQEFHINTSIISNGDMNLCVLFYGLCLVIIALLYYHFVRKRKMNPCNGFKNSKPLV